MRYIVHHRLKEKLLCGYVNLPYGTVLTRKDNYFLYYYNEKICTVTSQIAKEHISRDDDGRGLDRGRLTYAIAFKSTNNPGFKFTDKQREIIIKKYSHFIRDDCDYIIFNDKFFDADVEDLEKMAEDLNIKI